MNNTAAVVFIMNSTVGTVHPKKMSFASFKFQNPSRHKYRLFYCLSPFTFAAVKSSDSVVCYFQ